MKLAIIMLRSNRKLRIARDFLAYWLTFGMGDGIISESKIAVSKRLAKQVKAS